MRNKAFKTVLSILILFVVISIIITSCQPGTPTLPGSTSGGFKIPTATFTSTLTPTRYCPSNIIYVSPTPITYSPLLLVVLFNPNAATDVEGKGRDFSLEYKDGTGSTDPQKYILDIMPHIIYAGDQYAIFQLGYENYEDAWVNDYSVATLDVPPSRGTYQGESTLTPFNTPATVAPGLPGLATLNYIQTEVSKFGKTSTAIANNNICANSTFVAQVNSTATAFSITQTAQSGLLSTQAAIMTSTPHIKATPFDEDEIYYGLNHATTQFENLSPLGGQYSRRVLLIISTMQDPLSGYKGMIKEYGIDLSNVDVITVLPNCWENIFQPSCKSTIATWTAEFKEAKAKSFTFVNGNDLENYLISQLRGER